MLVEPNGQQQQPYEEFHCTLPYRFYSVHALQQIDNLSGDDFRRLELVIEPDEGHYHAFSVFHFVGHEPAISAICLPYLTLYAIAFNGLFEAFLRHTDQ